MKLRELKLRCTLHGRDARSRFNAFAKKVSQDNIVVSGMDCRRIMEGGAAAVQKLANEVEGLIQERERELAKKSPDY